MEFFFDCFVNLSPIIMILLFIGLFLFSELEELFLGCSSTILAIYFFLFERGNGNLILGCITQFLILSVMIILLVCGIYYILKADGKIIIPIIIIFIAFLVIIYCLYISYHRLRAEGVLVIKVIDEIEKEILKIKISQEIYKIMNNEWVKGIVIGAIGAIIGGVISGLVLNKIIKNDKKDSDNPEK